MVFSHYPAFHEDIQKGWILAMDGDSNDHPDGERGDALLPGILELAEPKQKSNQSIAR